MTIGHLLRNIIWRRTDTYTDKIRAFLALVAPLFTSFIMLYTFTLVIFPWFTSTAKTDSTGVCVCVYVYVYVYVCV